MKSPLRACRLRLRKKRKIRKPTTAAAKIAEPTETPALKAILCVTPMEETAEAVRELEPEAVGIPDGGIIVMIVGCKVIVIML